MLVLGAGAVGLLCAFASKAAGAKAVVIADIQADRVKFAVDNGFADAGVTVPLPEKRPETIDEKLAYARGVADKVKNAEIGSSSSSSGVAVGEVSATFECTGVESCMHTAIYVSFTSSIVPYITRLSPLLKFSIRFLLRERTLFVRYMNEHVLTNTKSRRNPAAR